jgi:hypothetical protein
MERSGDEPGHLNAMHVGLMAIERAERESTRRLHAADHRLLVWGNDQGEIPRMM